MSAPAQNARPLPVTTMARTCGSASAGIEQRVELGREAAAPRVHPLGPVERQHGDAAVAYLVEDRVVGTHRAAPHS